jgi:hypothetical protein
LGAQTAALQHFGVTPGVFFLREFAIPAAPFDDFRSLGKLAVAA